MSETEFSGIAVETVPRIFLTCNIGESLTKLHLTWNQKYVTYWHLSSTNKCQCMYSLIIIDVYGDQIEDVSTVRWWVMHFSSDNSDVNGKPTQLSTYKIKSTLISWSVEKDGFYGLHFLDNDSIITTVKKNRFLWVCHAKSHLSIAKIYNCSIHCNF